MSHLLNVASLEVLMEAMLCGAKIVLNSSLSDISLVNRWVIISYPLYLYLNHNLIN